MLNKIYQTCDYIKNKTNFLPEYAIILGSGLGGFVDDIQVEYTLPYSEIPNFPITTVKGHNGALIFGTIGNKKVMAMQGRFHYYEGYDMKEVTFPVRVMKYLGVQKMIASNASGGVNSNYKVGSIVIIKDHINMFPEHPLRGQNEERMGERFVNMSEPYSKKMIQKARELAKQFEIEIEEGVYVGLQGPTYETLSEYKMVKNIGGDCVGMSTIPEIIVAKHMNMECFGISVITDIGNEENIEEVSHAEVMKAAKKAEPNLRKLIKELVINY